MTLPPSCGAPPPRLTCADIAPAPAASGGAFLGERGRRGVAARERTVGRTAAGELLPASGARTRSSNLMDQTADLVHEAKIYFYTVAGPVRYIMHVLYVMSSAQLAARHFHHMNEMRVRLYEYE
eukprot:COSAG01_NODE_228_length_21104_cov_210.303832_15_plen_124_part_00